MFIKNIFLENWKNIRKTALEFKKVNIFVGENGSGKSALLSGIGYLINSKSLEATQDDYRMWLEEYYKIYGEIVDRQSENLKLGITFKKTASKILKIQNDPEVYTSARLINEILKKRINAEISDWSSISSQGNSTAILDADNSVASQKLKQIFGIDQLTEASESFKQDISSTNTEIDLLKKEIDVMEAISYTYQVVPDLPDIENQKKEFARLTDLKAQYEANKILKAEYESKLKIYNSYIQNLQELQNLKKEIENKIKNLFSRELKFDQNAYDNVYKELLSLESEQKNYQVLLESYSKLKNQWDSTKSEIEKLSNLLQENKEKISSILNKLKDSNIPTERVVQLEADIKLLQERKIMLKFKIEQLESNLILAEKGECPTCHQSCDHLNIEAVKTELENNNAELYKCVEDIRHLRSELNQCEEEAKIVSDLHNQKIQLEQQETFYTNKLLESRKGLELLTEPVPPIDNSNISQRLTSLKENLSVLTKEKQDYESFLQDQSLLNKELNLINEKIEKENSRIKETDKPEINFEEVDFPELTYLEIQKSLNIYEEKVKHRNEIIEYNKQIDAQKEQTEKVLGVKKQELLKLQKDVSDFTQARRLIDKEITPFVIKRSQSILIKKMNDFINPIFPYIELGVKEGSATFDFTFMNKQVGYPSKLKMASGFQRQGISLAYRVALTTISSINLFLGDEIDSDSSVNNSLKLYKNLMNQNFDQYFIATHKKETIEMLINEYDARVFYVVDGKIYCDDILLDGENYDLKNIEIKGIK